MLWTQWCVCIILHEGTVSWGVRDWCERSHDEVSALSLLSSKITFLAFMEYLSHLGFQVTGDEVERGKPAPDIFLEAARRLGCKPEHCVVFEDSPLGVAGAHAAGCCAVALPDPRMSANFGRFEDLAPRWLLPDGIGTFEMDSIRPIPPSMPLPPKAQGSMS